MISGISTVAFLTASSTKPALYASIARRAASSSIRLRRSALNSSAVLYAGSVLP